MQQQKPGAGADPKDRPSLEPARVFRGGRRALYFHTAGHRGGAALTLPESDSQGIQPAPVLQVCFPWRLRGPPTWKMTRTYHPNPMK